jgi:hypothetical protein
MNVKPLRGAGHTHTVQASKYGRAVLVHLDFDAEGRFFGERIEEAREEPPPIGVLWAEPPARVQAAALAKARAKGLDL